MGSPRVGQAHALAASVISLGLVPVLFPAAPAIAIGMLHDESMTPLQAWAALRSGDPRRKLGE